jgi:F-type H+-transporting ATPase subunit b
MATPAKTTATTQAHGGAHGAEHGGGFPPFNASTFASQLLWLAIVFAFLYWLMAKVVVPRIGGILADRATRISSDLDEAAAMKAKAEEAGAAYEKALGEARARAQTLAQDTRDKAAAASNERRKALEADLAAKVTTAELNINAMKTKAMTNVAGIAADAASAIVQRLTGVVPAKVDVTSAVNASAKG